MSKRDKYKLRPIKPEDSAAVLGWRNSENVRRNMYTDHVISENEHAQWMKRVVEGDGAKYLIFEIEGFPVGLVNVVQIDAGNSKCYWGFYIGVADAPPGSGSIMEYLALQYIFEELGIRKLYCEVFAFNKTVIKLHKKFGFIEEGCFKQHVLKEGAYEDVLSMALFATEWSNIRPKIERIIFRAAS
jgi:UDP-4-amino-4,6-dideoxy-N-acetyl-beta-L-altrosamine N-acetyltransferase